MRLFFLDPLPIIGSAPGFGQDLVSTSQSPTYFLKISWFFPGVPYFIIISIIFLSWSDISWAEDAAGIASVKIRKTAIKAAKNRKRADLISSSLRTREIWWRRIAAFPIT